MIQITPHVRILLAVEPVDGRKGVDSLAQLCREKLNSDPFSGCLFIFRNRSARAIRERVGWRETAEPTRSPAGGRIHKPWRVWEIALGMTQAKTGTSSTACQMRTTFTQRLSAACRIARSAEPRSGARTRL